MKNKTEKTHRNGRLSQNADMDTELLNQEGETERSLKRKDEDDDYIPVIIKRSDESVRHPDDVLTKAIDEGLEQLRRPFLSLLLSSIGAGLILGFTAMAVALMATFTSGSHEPAITRITMALVYPLGFIVCIMSGTQLFTEHTATAVYPFLGKQANFKELIRLWAIVVVGNVTGAVGSAGLLALADDVIMATNGYVFIGHHLVNYDFNSLIISSLLAGWLMALGGWLVLVTSPGISQIVCIYLVTFLIGFGGLHHSIAGSVEMFAALFVSDEFTVAQALNFIGSALLGNLIGGSIFVAGFNYSHIRKTQQV